VKGLLHRLAARASGTTVPVRSDARLPFGGTDLSRSAEVSDGPIAESLHVHEAAPLSPPMDRAREDPQARRTDGSIPISAGQSTLPAAPGLAQAGELETRLPMRLVCAAPAQTEAIAAFELESSPIPTPGRAETHHESSPSRAARLSDEPSLLMPAAAAPAKSQRQPGASPARTNPSAAARDAASESATEVHIHIGRIDVTAVHEPAPPRRTPPKSPAPMSLDSYLAKRGRT
jgi:hypothetical protein